MINMQYKLVSPLVIDIFYENLDYDNDGILVRPEMLSICKADIRYYFGMRDAKIIRRRLPLALIHEACGSVLYDKGGRYSKGDKVVLLPNIPGKDTRYGENYRLDSRFRSSRADGFMQEMISLPQSQILPYSGIRQEIAAITEFISVGMHAVMTYSKKKEGKIPEHLAVWGDGALGYVICCLLKYFYPRVHLTVIGANQTKLGMFWFADACLTVDEVGERPQYDDAFECVGGQESGNAISQMIETVMPEGILTLMGVSEEPVPVNTRLVLEKGLVLLGRSRSAKEDFEKVIEILETNQKFADRIRMLISEVVAVREVDDIHRAFNQSLLADFKLVMDWKL